MENKIKSENLVYFFLIIGLVYSIYNSFYDTIKFDKYFINSNGGKTHHILRTDINAYWKDAHKFKSDIKSGKTITESGAEYTRSFLYPRLIAIYYILINEEIKNENGDYKLKNYKVGIPLIQSLFYYFCLFLFYKKIVNKLQSKSTVAFIILFLSLEPNIIQYHSSYWTESLYLSLLLLFFSFFFQEKRKNYSYFFLGLFIGIMYMQRNVSIYLILPVLFYLLIYLKNKIFVPALYIFIGYFIILSFVGYSNYKQSKVFYLMPFHQLTIHWNYVATKLISNKLKINAEEAEKKKQIDLNDWKKENNINLDNYEDVRKVYKYKNRYFLNLLKDNYFFYAKYHIWKSFQALVFSVDAVKSEYLNDKTVERYWSLPDFDKYQKYKIIYSFFIYIISLIGFILILLKGNSFEKKIAFFIVLICLYFIAALGWVGTGRYMVTNQIFFSIFFGYGLNFLYTIIKQKVK